jgi:DnaJ-class molecular chaperone
MSVNKEPNLYKLLQVDPEAEVGIIRVAYEFLVEKYEPSNELTGDPYKHNYVIAAWEILSKDTSRARYDEHLRKSET